jgi:hypothetical protein
MSVSDAVLCDLWIVFFLAMASPLPRKSPAMNSSSIWPWGTGGGVRRFGFLALALVIAGLTACNRSPSAQIERVLDRCEAIGRQASNMNLDAASKAHFVATSFQEIDVSGCPEDFRVAFQQHVNAWRQFQMAASNNNIVNNVVVGAVAGMTNDPSGIGQIQSDEASAQDAVNQTYYQLTEIAAEYGARVPNSVVR